MEVWVFGGGLRNRFNTIKIKITKTGLDESEMKV
jgi:hypothetical protein